MKILLVKTAFCPNKTYLNITMQSLIKTNIFLGLLKNDNLQFDLYMIGWCYKYLQHLELFLRIIKMHFHKIFKSLSPINLGKYSIYNQLIDFCKVNTGHVYDYIIFLDHDVYFDITNIDTFNKLFAENVMQDNFGIIAFNQKGDCRHQALIYENKINNNGIEFVWTTNNASIATGGFIIAYDVFKSLSHFDIISVYGLDDYHICKKLTNMNFINVVTNDIYIYHPFDNNPKYAAWKKNNIHRLVNGEIIDYYRNIEEVINIFE